jgi:hypothetical protein
MQPTSSWQTGAGYRRLPDSDIGRTRDRLREIVRERAL